MEKIVMKNSKTGMYWCHTCFPPLTNDVWKADKFDSATEAKSSVNHLMAEKYQPQDFIPVKVIASEEPV